MRRRRLLAIVLALLVAGVAAFAAWRAWSPSPGGPPMAPADTTGEGVRAVTLWFANEEGDSLVAVSQPMVEREGLHERVAALVDALVRDGARRAVPTLPAGTGVLHVYLDDRGLLVLDLSRAFTQGFHGGSRAEWLAVGSLVRTLGANVPEAQRVLLTCDGGPLASLGGHVPLDRPLEIQDW